MTRTGSDTEDDIERDAASSGGSSEGSSGSEPARPPRRWHRAVRRPGPGLVAVLTWAVTAPAAAALPAKLGLDPFVQADATVPLVAGGLIAVLAGGLALARRGPATAGVAAGLFASWAVLLLRTGWQGTPFPPGGFYGDAGRLAAMATRYTVTAASSDGIVAGVPSEYPPLYPWLIGRAAVLLHTDAWRLLAPAALIAMSLSVVLSFALWSRMTSPRAALAISALELVVFGRPDKAYEVLALAVVVPLILLTTAAPPRGRPHWLLAGLMGGLLALTYYAYLLYAALGVLVLVVSTWRAETDRRAYSWYLARVVAVMLLVSSWFLVPYARAMLHGGQEVADMYESSAISGDPFAFLQATPQGLVEMAGVAGLLWLWRTAWWARPLAAVAGGAYGYYLLSFLRFVTTLHTGLLHYVIPLVSACLLASGVLTVRHLVPAIARHAGTPVPGRAPTAVAVLAMGVAGYLFWSQNMPAVHWRPGPAGTAVADFTADGLSNRQAVRAHTQPYADGHRPRFYVEALPAGDSRVFPVDRIRQEVEMVLGPGARPRTLSYDEQLFAYLPWPGYIGVDRGSASAPSRWDDRYAELSRLSAMADPFAFARASAGTGFGSIDVFVLQWRAPYLVWRPRDASAALRFEPQVFDPGSFIVVDGLAGDTVLAIRRP